MPLVRIDLVEGKSADYRQAVGEVIYDAMRAVIDVPENDRFQIVTEHKAENLIFDRTYLGVARSDDCVFIQVTLSAGRTVEKKRAFYKAVVDGLHERLSLRREDVFINLVETGREDWSFGNGVAHYSPG